LSEDLPPSQIKLHSTRRVDGSTFVTDGVRLWFASTVTPQFHWGNSIGAIPLGQFHWGLRTGLVPIAPMFAF